MDEAELEAYWLKKNVIITLFNNHINYDNIEDPLQTLLLQKQKIILSPNSVVKKIFNFEKHTFTDNISRF